ncbi:MAG: Crp/Fnr family transcriptional regulator [Burkholderiaceae bacterium]
MPQHKNLLVAALPRADRMRLLGGCESVNLLLAQVLCEAGEPTRHVYFPTESFVSLIAQVDGNHDLEVGMAGHEGMLGVQLVLGVAREPLKALVQGAGAAWRMAAAPFLVELERSVALRLLLQKYLYVLMAQRSTSDACVRFHEIGPRLARWLLMSQDRAHADQFPMTQEFLAMMLGVRRVSITAAAGDLLRRGLIDYHRGELTVLDRAGLEAAACSCFAADLEVYRRTMKARR